MPKLEQQKGLNTKLLPLSNAAPKDARTFYILGTYLTVRLARLHLAQKYSATSPSALHLPYMLVKQHVLVELNLVTMLQLPSAGWIAPNTHAHNLHAQDIVQAWKSAAYKP